MKVTENNKEKLIEKYIRDIYMSTQFANPAWNHHIKPTIKTIKGLSHRGLVSQYALTLELIIRISKQCNILSKILHDEPFEPYSLKRFSENFERIAKKEINRELTDKERILIFRREAAAQRKKTNKSMKLELTILVENLKALGFKKTKNGKYIKKTKEGKFEVIPLIDFKRSSFKYVDNEYIVYIDPVRQSYMFVNKKDLRIGIAYDRVNDETTCSKINKKNRPSIVICSKRIKEMLDKYIDIIDEEFRQITKPNRFWYIA